MANIQLVPRKKAPLLTRLQARCLSSLLTAELDQEPVEFHTWRAKNAKQIPTLEYLKRYRMIDGDSHCVITLWGVMNVPGKRAQTVLMQISNLFKTLKKYYPDHPKEPIALDDLAQQVKLGTLETLQSAYFLSRSPAYLSVNTSNPITKIFPTEKYVTFNNFKAVKDATREQAIQVIKATESLPVSVTNDYSLLFKLGSSESEEVRDCWNKALDRKVSDPSGAITAARSLVEAACKHILNEYGEKIDESIQLPQLYKKAAAHLKLDVRPNLDETLRGVLSGSATIIHGLAHLRNTLGDAHGKERHSAKPAQRHADFAVMIAGATASFLLATLDAQRTP